MLKLNLDFTNTFKENSHYDRLQIAYKSRKHFGSVLISKPDICLFYTFKKNLTVFFLYFSYILLLLDIPSLKTKAQLSIEIEKPIEELFGSVKS